MKKYLVNSIYTSVFRFHHQALVEVKILDALRSCERHRHSFQQMSFHKDDRSKGRGRENGLLPSGRELLKVALIERLNKGNTGSPCREAQSECTG